MCLDTEFRVCLRNYMFEYGIPSSNIEFPCSNEVIRCLNMEFRACIINSLFVQENMKSHVCIWNSMFEYGMPFKHGI